MTIANNIKAVNIAAKKVHGEDINIMIVRCIAMEHDDNLVIVTGNNHKAAAMDFVKTIKDATVEEEYQESIDWGDGDVSPAYTKSIIKF